MLKNIGLSNLEITNLTKECIQPNAVDLKLDRIWKIESDEFYISEKEKKHRTLTEIKWDLTNQFNYSPTPPISSKQMTLLKYQRGVLVG